MFLIVFLWFRYIIRAFDMSVRAFERTAGKQYNHALKTVFLSI